MGYPDLPNNRLIVNGVDLTARYGMILTDGYTMDPPEPKTYEVDIPGGDGKIDLTETLLGDTAYKNRKMEFEFYLIDVEDYEDIMTEINTFLHGKSYDFKLTMDIDYTYHGRFTVSSMSQGLYPLGLVGKFKVTIDAEPFKYRADRVYKIDAVGGETVYLESGRKRVRPTIETTGFVKVIFNNKLVKLPAGSWSVNDVLFKEGANEIYFNTYDIKSLTWKELKESSVTCLDFTRRRLYEWYKSRGNGTYVIETWNDEVDKTWGDLADKKWADLVYMSEMTKTVDPVYVKYKVGDL